MSPESKRHLSDTDAELTDSDSLADEIAPKVKKSHKAKKKHKKHKSKQEKKKKHDYDDEITEKSHKKHKHKRKKHKKHGSDNENNDEDDDNNNDVPSKRIRLSSSENGNLDSSKIGEAAQHNDKSVNKNADVENNDEENQISEAIDNLEKQKAMLQAALLQDENGFEDGELSTVENNENGTEIHSEQESNDDASKDRHNSKKKKKKEKSRSKEEKAKKSKTKSQKESSPTNHDNYKSKSR